MNPQGTGTPPDGGRPANDLQPGELAGSAAPTVGTFDSTTVTVPVADLASVLDAAVDAYEAACWAADMDMVDFHPYAALSRAITILRGLVRAGGGTP